MSEFDGPKIFDFSSIQKEINPRVPHSLHPVVIGEFNGDSYPNNPANAFRGLNPLDTMLVWYAESAQSYRHIIQRIEPIAGLTPAEIILEDYFTRIPNQSFGDIAVISQRSVPVTAGIYIGKYDLGSSYVSFANQPRIQPVLLTYTKQGNFPLIYQPVSEMRGGIVGNKFEITYYTPKKSPTGEKLQLEKAYQE
jgi:hypothetical protein